MVLDAHTPQPEFLRMMGLMPFLSSKPGLQPRRGMKPWPAAKGSALLAVMEWA